jgi:hypothetical protein
MKRIVLKCSYPPEGCEHCIFNGKDGCFAPKGLDDCFKHVGVWKIEEVKDDSVRVGL